MGPHILLKDVRKTLVAYDNLFATLTFARAGRGRIEIVVETPPDAWAGASAARRSPSTYSSPVADLSTWVGSRLDILRARIAATSSHCSRPGARFSGAPHMSVNKTFLLHSRPSAEAPAGPHNFRLVEEPIPAPAEGEVLVRHRWLSLDPYMRGRMNDAKSYAQPQKLGAPMIGGTVGEVVESKLEGFAPGDLVLGMGGWRLYSLASRGSIRKLDPRALPEEAWLGPAGMPGVTAWVGLNTIVKPKAGETVVVTAATGAVGTVAGQLARRMGARVVGVAGGSEKCRYAVESLGFDACVDHRAGDFAQQFKAATPDGVDGVFENVGGLPLELSLARANPFGRIAICGLVASGYDGTPAAVTNFAAVLAMRLLVKGFIVGDDMSLWPKAYADLVPLIASGELKWARSVAQGLEAAPQAFFDMLKGRNFGKQLVKLV